MKTYLQPRSEKDILEMQDRGDAEGPHLEFKSKRLFEQKNDKVFETLSKEVSAFSNSEGGVLIIGIEEDDDRRIQEVSPITASEKTETWIENGLLPRISPPAPVSINRIQLPTGHLLVIDAPASFQGPHQAADKRYYARRLFRVDPLLPYEIDDIRRRKGDDIISASLALSFELSGINFTITNQGLRPIYDVHIQISGVDNLAIANTWHPGLSRPYTEPFRVLYPGEHRYFPGAGFEFFEELLGDQMPISLHFSSEDGLKQEKPYTYYLQDFKSTAEQKSNLERLLDRGIDQISKSGKSLGDIGRTLKKMNESAFYPTGLNLSNTTLQALSVKETWKWPGQSMTFAALAEILDVDIQTALKIQQELFGSHHFSGAVDSALEDIDIPDPVKNRIRKLISMPAKNASQMPDS